MTMVVLLTGGIGAGKSAVSAKFQALGISIIDNDVDSRRIMEPGQPAYAAICERWGKSVLNADCTLNRAEIRRRIFADPAERKWLEQLTHPLIGQETLRGIRDATSPYCVLVVPLINPAKRNPLANRILVVDAPEQVQLQRTMERDANSEAQVKAIMAAQTTREQRLAVADDIIINDGSLADLDAKVLALHQQYLALAKVSE